MIQTNTDDLEVIARAELHPIMWTKKYGKGDVLIFTLGHGDYSMKNEGFKRLFRNSVKWIIEGGT